MPILSSIVVWDQTQADGRRWVRERHTDQLGIAQFRDYLANVGVVIADGFPAIVSILNQALIDSEIQQNLVRIYEAGAAAVVTVQHAPLADIRAALRVAYLTARREQAFALGAFLNTLTDAQLGTLFGVSGAALAALRTRLQTKASQWTTYLAGAGE